MGGQESILLSLPEKDLVQNVKNKKFYWVTKKDNKEITRMEVDKATIIDLNTKTDPLRPDIPFFIIWPETYSRTASERKVASADSYYRQDHSPDGHEWMFFDYSSPTTHVSEYKLYILDFKYQGNEIRKELQVYKGFVKGFVNSYGD